MKSSFYILYLIITFAVSAVYPYTVVVERTNVYHSSCDLLWSNDDNGYAFDMDDDLWDEVKSKLEGEGFSNIPNSKKYCFIDHYNDGTGDYNMAGFTIDGKSVYLRKNNEQDEFTLFVPPS